MLFLLKGALTVSGESSDARYVYSVATDPAYRGRGILRELDEQAAQLAKSEGAKALVLVPAAAGLFEIYRRLGYRTRFYLCETRVSPSVNSGAVLLPCGPRDFLTLRREKLRRDGNTFDLYPELCEFRYYEYLFPYPGRPRGEIFRVESHGTTGYTAGCQDGSRYLIQETDLTGQALADAAGALREQSGAETVTVLGRQGRRFPFGMIKLLDQSLDMRQLRTADLYMNLMFS